VHFFGSWGNLALHLKARVDLRLSENLLLEASWQAAALWHLFTWHWNSFPRFFLDQRPVIVIVIFIPHSIEKILKNPPQMIIVRFFFEFQISAISHEVNEFLWYSGLLLQALLRGRVAGS
jgi:hypothetical protein